MWIFDYDKNEGLRELTAYIFTIAFVVGPPIWMMGIENFLIGLFWGLIALLAQFGIIYLVTNRSQDRSEVK